jgi:hypothetical protein
MCLWKIKWFGNQGYYNTRNFVNYTLLIINYIISIVKLRKLRCMRQKVHVYSLCNFSEETSSQVTEDKEGQYYDKV